MAFRMYFDGDYNIMSPTLILCKRDGYKQGMLIADKINVKDQFNTYSELSFTVYKYLDDVINPLWDEIKDFKLIWCKEWDLWFDLTIDVDESSETTKKCTCKTLAESELSNINVYDLNINTDDQVSQSGYQPTVLYSTTKSRSLIDKILSFAPHYTIAHVDDNIKTIKKTFTFTEKSIYDVLIEVSNACGIIIVFNNNTDQNGHIARSLSLYDLMTHCNNCGYRGEFSGVCPDCGSSDITNGYGEDTTVYIDNENLADQIELKTDDASVYNCFRMKSGSDDLQTAIKKVNINGTDYLWHLNADTKADMSSALQTKLTQYDALYADYMTTHTISINASKVSTYNTLVSSYVSKKPDLVSASATVSGYKNLIKTMANAADFAIFLQSQMLPSYSYAANTAQSQAALITNSISPVGINGYDPDTSAETVNSAVLQAAENQLSKSYKVSIKSSSYNEMTAKWTGVLTVTNESNTSDTADTSSLTITINNSYESEMQRSINAIIRGGFSENYDILGVIHQTISFSNNTYSGAFVTEIKKYNLETLNAFAEIIQSILDTLTQDGISVRETWLYMNPDMYTLFYVPYKRRQDALRLEINARKAEIQKIDEYINACEVSRQSVQETLNFADYLGADLYKELLTFRREYVYTNDSISSDGFNNAQLYESAKQFINTAKNELIKSSTLQHSITTKLKNLLVIEAFRPLVNHFSVGNWIRVRVDDKLFKLRLIGYTVDFSSLENIDVQFSDVLKVADGYSDVKSILDQAKSMASTYQAVDKAAAKGAKKAGIIDRWFEEGLNATYTKIVKDADDQEMQFDNHGLLLRKKDQLTDRYYDEQLKVINSTIIMTNDDWETTKVAIGKFLYLNPATGQLESAFGVNGETIVGKIIIGQNLKMYNAANTLSFDENGLSVSNNTHSFIVNPSATSLITVKKGTDNLLSLNAVGDLVISGHIKAKSISTGSRTSAGTGTAGIYIDSSGNLYAGSSNQTIIYANGNINLGNGKFVYDGSTLTVNGAITATSLSTGGRTSSDTGTAGIYISSNGALYAGSDNDTIIYANGTAKLKGTITATTFKAIGTNENSYCTIGDRLYYKHEETGIATEFIRLVEYFDTINSTKIYDVLSLWGNEITFSRTNNGSATIYYEGIGTIGVNGSLEISSGLTVDGVSHFENTCWHSASIVTTEHYYTEKGLRYVGGYDSNGAVQSCNIAGFSSTDSILYFGEGSSTTYTQGTSVRGKNVRLFAFSGGGVYLGSSGSTAVTSDETLKDLFDIDDRYIDFFNNLNPVLYKYKTGHRTHIGFGAQSVEKALSDARLTTEEFAGVLIDKDVNVGEDENISPDGKTHFDELHSLRYEEFISLNTMMIKKLQSKLEYHEQKNKELEKRIAAMEAKLC